MIKKFTNFLAMMLCFMGLSAQSAIVPVGGTAVCNDGTTTYTVGQPADQFLNGSEYTINQGVQQPYEFMTVGVDNYKGIVLDAIIFPNPTHQFVQLLIRGYEIPQKGLQAKLFTTEGQLLQTFSVTEMQTLIDIGSYSASTYILSISEDRHSLKTFKIVKNF